jgi:hypothetical protein
VLATAVRTQKALLFVGAGLSAGLGLPTFQQLVGRIGEGLGYDADVFQKLADNYTLAEFYRLKKGTLGELRSSIDREWHRPDIDISRSETHRLIVELDFPLIYTTNWDSWLEKAFERHGKPYAKIVSVADLAAAKPDVTQIIKFHGDLANDDSLVLTESSYFDRLSFESPLDIRLRADALGKSILFIGYSMADINMRLLIYKLQKIWEASTVPSVRPKSFLLLARPSEPLAAVLDARGITPLVSEEEDATKGLQHLLSDLLERVRQARSQ